MDNQRGRPNKFATSGNQVLPHAGLVPSAFSQPAHAAGGTLRQRGAFHAGCMRRALLHQRSVPAILLFLKLKTMLPEALYQMCRRRNPDMAIFHYTVKIVGRSKGKSVISASAYLNGDVMKNEETGRISYYTSKKEVVYTSLMMCENAPPEWQIVPEENIKRFQNLSDTKGPEDKAALRKI